MILDNVQGQLKFLNEQLNSLISKKQLLEIHLQSYEIGFTTCVKSRQTIQAYHEEIWSLTNELNSMNECYSAADNYAPNLKSEKMLERKQFCQDRIEELKNTIIKSLQSFDSVCLNIFNVKRELESIADKILNIIEQLSSCNSQVEEENSTPTLST